MTDHTQTAEDRGAEQSEAVESIARALYLKDRDVPDDAWARDLPESVKELWRGYARTALAALSRASTGAGAGSAVVPRDKWLDWRGAVEGMDASILAAKKAVRQVPLDGNNTNETIANSVCWTLGLDHVWKHVAALRAALAVRELPSVADALRKEADRLHAKADDFLAAAPPQPAAETPAPGDLGKTDTEKNWDVVKQSAQIAVYGHDGRGLIGGHRRHLVDRVARAILKGGASPTPSARAGGMDREAVARIIFANQQDHLSPAESSNAFDAPSWSDYRRRAFGAADQILATAAPDRAPVADLGVRAAYKHAAQIAETHQPQHEINTGLARQIGKNIAASIRAHAAADPAAGAGEDGWRGIAADEERIASWVVDRFGADSLNNLMERADRLLEEAIEMQQAVYREFEPRVGCTGERQAERLVRHVYNKKAGDPRQEMGGVMTCALALGRRLGVRLDRAAQAELTRIEALSKAHFDKRHQAKVDAGVAAQHDRIAPPDPDAPGGPDARGEA